MLVLPTFLATGCGSSSDSGSGSAFGRQVKWECTPKSGAPLAYDYCTCEESEQGTPEAKCPAQPYQCCFAMEDAMMDNTWSARCECVMPDRPEEMGDGNDAAELCAELKSSPQNDEYTRNFHMVNSCGVN